MTAAVVQELKKENDALKEENAALRAELSALRNDVSEIKALLKNGANGNGK